MQSHCYLVTYDISDPKRWRRVYQTMHGFGQHLQLSVFRCELTEPRAVRLRNALDRLIHHGEDQVVIARLGPTSIETLSRFDILGRPAHLALPGPTVV